MHEAIRVTKPGGAILISDAHYTSFDIDSEYIDLVWRIRRAKTESHTNGYVANRLPRFMKEAGLSIERIEPFAFYTTDFDMAYLSLLPHIAENTVAVGAATQAEMEAFMAEQQRRADEGLLFVTASVITVVGRKPVS